MKWKPEKFISFPLNHKTKKVKILFEEVMNIIKINHDILKNIDSLQFSIFEIANLISRKLVLPTIAYIVFQANNLYNIFKE